MKKLIVIITILMFPSFGLSQSIQQSHIEANLPETYEEFLKILDRDLNTYFYEENEKSISVNFVLLRSVPTQSGVSYPKLLGRDL